MSNENHEENEREELMAVAEFLERLKEMAKELISTLTGGIDGKKLGEDIAAFYRSLEEIGLPSEMVKKMTEEYFKKRLEAIPDLGTLIKQFTTQFKPWFKHQEIEKKEEGEEQGSRGE